LRSPIGLGLKHGACAMAATARNSKTIDLMPLAAYHGANYQTNQAGQMAVSDR